ncbi:MAG: DUF4268 domain-containing protein [Gammaproteobacteria bacterium]|nr:DUF4268 domain-containing protein [Gammaproteobacteria bacterium]
MFTVDRESNRISPVTATTFDELGLRERDHLQEWLAHEPSALGEELLIIQKEFAGFTDTRERLDLLALDKDGNLVIIENKLDDSGRDVAWQAIKYASYCRSLKKGEIVDIFQQYLDGHVGEFNDGDDVDASSQICEFMNASDLDEVRLNPGHGQRIIMVARSFRKEVTCAALWLIDYGINIQCHKVTPYSLGEKILISVEQIIPMPEADELMISIRQKEEQEKNTQIELRKSEKLRLKYWELCLESFQGSSCDLYNNINASKDHWLSAGSGMRGCPYSLIFGKNELRVEIVLGRSSTKENKLVFDFLHKSKEEIEGNFGETMEWRRLDEKISSKIQFSCKMDGYDEDLWQGYIQWHLEYMTKLENALKKPLLEAQNQLSNEGWQIESLNN